MEESPRPIWIFGPFRLDSTERLLFLEDRPIHLTPKAFDVLVVLVKRSGQLVTKDELLRLVWPEAFVEEATLAKNIFTIRKALGEQADGSAYIETVPKKGYRFLGRVDICPPKDKQVEQRAVDDVDAPPSSSPIWQHRDSQSSFRRYRLLAAVFILAAAAVGIGWLQIARAGRHAPVPSAPKQIQSLAVLPLANLSGDSSQDFFADGMTDELITVLTELHSVQVTSRTSSTRYRKTSKSLSQIAGELHVDAVLEGAVVRSGEQVRVTVQLIDGSSDRHLWAASYERPIADALTIQADIAREVARQIQVEITPAEAARLQRHRPIDPEAQEQYLLGRYYWDRRDSADLRKAAQHFQNAISIDPNYAPAYAGLADCHLAMPIFHNDSAGQLLFRAKAAAQHAIQLDDSLGEAHVSLASVLEREWDFSGAEREYLRAIELNPGYATGHQWYGEFLSGMNRMDEALEQYRLAMKLDPLSPVIHMEAALPYRYRGQYDEALRRLHDALKIDPSFATTHGQLGYVLSDAGDQEAAQLEFQQAVKGGIGEAPWIKTGIAIAYARSGNRRQARRYLTQLIAMDRRSHLLGMHVAAILVALGENDQAIHWMQRAYQLHEWELCWAGIAPALAPLRDDPRAQEIVRNIGLPPSATAAWHLPSHSAKL